MPEACYLCGAPITDDESADHIPPKQFFAQSIRSQLNLSQLITVPTHGACNRGFGHDEEYFTWCLSSVAFESVAGRAVVDDNAKRFRTGQAVGLGLKTIREFEERPSGLHLPGNLVVKRVEGKRLTRVIWKVIRGLYFVENRSILPEDTPFKSEIVEPARANQVDSNELWEAVKDRPSCGVYGGIFDYKYLDVTVEDIRLHAWGLLLWDQVMIFVAHHHPNQSLRTA